MSMFFKFYFEANLVCIIIFGILLAHDLLRADRQEKQIKYEQAQIPFMLYFTNDIFWAAVIAGILPKNIFTVVLLNFFNYVLLAAIAYTWLRYTMAAEMVPDREKTVKKFAILFPFLVATAALVIIFFAAPQLLYDGSLELQPLYYVFLVAVPIIYIAAVLVYTIRKAVKEENRIEKRKHLGIGLFPLMVVAGGLVEIILLPDTPIFCFSCTILTLIFYIQAMETQISADPLTALNNRHQLMRFVSQKTNLHREGRKTFVIMFDINDFKMINDTYGHAEGDRALVIVADSLKHVASTNNTLAFLGRYGGDEFIAIAQPVQEEGVSSLISEIRNEISSECAEDGRPYLLSAGAGYEEFVSDKDTFEQCLRRADKNLYKDKKYCKQNGQSTICH